MSDAKIALKAIAEVHAMHWHTKREGEDDLSSGILDKDGSLRWLHDEQSVSSIFCALITNLSLEAVCVFTHVYLTLFASF